MIACICGGTIEIGLIATCLTGASTLCTWCWNNIRKGHSGRRDVEDVEDV